MYIISVKKNSIQDTDNTFEKRKEQKLENNAKPKH